MAVNKGKYDVQLKGDTKGGLTLEYAVLRKGVLTLRAVDHPVRKKMLKFIEDKKKVIVSDIYSHLRIDQSVASQHLAVLRKADLVLTERDGKFIYYSINKATVGNVISLIEELV